MVGLVSHPGRVGRQDPGPVPADEAAGAGSGAPSRLPASTSTPYLNSIPVEHEPWFPGDEAIEKRVRAFIRWNAAIMVTRANMEAEGIGGHLSTYASSASLYEVGFNHFFRGKEHRQRGDQVFFQGHAAPGIYARAYLEGRLDEGDLDHFRREIGRSGLSSYPHPRLMPEFWEFPTVSMGRGPINAIYQARFNRYLFHRGLADTSQAKVWCFLGDGECLLAEHHDVAAELWSVTSYKALREEALAAARWNRLHPADQRRTARITDILTDTQGPTVAVTDFMKTVPDQVARWDPGHFTTLGTDGYGRSDTRVALRRHFETDAAHVVVAVLKALADVDDGKSEDVADAIVRHDIDTEAVEPRLA